MDTGHKDEWCAGKGQFFFVSPVKSSACEIQSWNVASLCISAAIISFLDLLYRFAKYCKTIPDTKMSDKIIL